MRYSFFLIFISIFGCSDNHTDDYYQGKLKIGVDENIKPLFESTFKVFENNNGERYQCFPIYLPESSLFDSLKLGTIQSIVSLRSLSDFEKNYFKSKNVYPIETHFGWDGIALITSIKNPINCLSQDSLNFLFSTKNETTPIIFDNNGSSNIHFIINKLGINALSKKASALKSIPAVLQYVTKSQNALGIVGTAWLSNLSSRQKDSLFHSLKIVKLQSPRPDLKLLCTDPSQEFLLDSAYLLMRGMYVINKKQMADAGSGFSSFIAGEIGQRIILKAGLLPKYMPGREVVIKLK